MGNTNMRYLRKKLDLTQGKMADILGISVRTLQYCEAGEIEPKLTVSAMQDFNYLVKEKTKVDILSIPGFEFSTERGRALFEHYEKLQTQKDTR